MKLFWKRRDFAVGVDSMTSVPCRHVMSRLTLAQLSHVVVAMSSHCESLCLLQLQLPISLSFTSFHSLLPSTSAAAAAAAVGLSFCRPVISQRACHYVNRVMFEDRKRYRQGRIQGSVGERG